MATRRLLQANDAMIVKVTKEAYEAWRKFSNTDGTYREMPAGLVEFDLPEGAYDEFVSGRLQGKTLSELILRMTARARPTDKKRDR
jgi:hypothetical protein